MQNPIVILREERNWSQKDLADALKLSLKEIEQLEEGIPNSPPGVVYFVLPELVERAQEYQDYRDEAREDFMSSLDGCVVPRNPDEFRRFLHEQNLTPQEFSHRAKIPMPEVFYALRTRIPASIEKLFSCIAL